MIFLFALVHHLYAYEICLGKELSLSSVCDKANTSRKVRSCVDPRLSSQVAKEGSFVISYDFVLHVKPSKRVFNFRD